MKAAILVEKNQPLVIDEIELPDTLSFGQIKIRILLSGLCGAQLQEIAGLKNNEKFMPHLLGHEGCGIVESIGPGVTKVKCGDKVVLHWRKASGIESDFPSYTWKGKKISGGKVTTLSEYSIVSENRITLIPNDLNNEFSALLGCGLSTGFSVVNKDANIKFGESVLVLGCGGIGLSCIYAANLSYAFPIIGVDINENKKYLVEKNKGSFCHLSEMEKTLKSQKFDCIIDTTGILELVSSVLPFLSEQGRCILVAQPKSNSQITITNPTKLFSTNGQSIRTTQAGGFDPDIDIPKYIKLYQNNHIDLSKLITHNYHLFDLNKAICKLKTENVGRIMINPN